MRRLGFLALAVVAALAAWAGEADALSGTKTYKSIIITVVITPSPVPTGGYLPGLLPGAQIAAEGAYGIGPPPPPMVVAQATPQGHVGVQMMARPDPNATYLHFVPHQPIVYAGYGPNSWTCVYEVYGYYPNAIWHMTDWVTGSVPSGTGPYPVYNAPSPSPLQWFAEGVSTAFKPFANGGSPGELTFRGVAGVSQQRCIDLQLNVDPSIAAGTYATGIQYSLIFGS